MAGNNIYIDRDLLIDPFFKTERPKGVLKWLKIYKNYMDRPKSIRELFVLNQLCYFMVRNSIMSEKRFTKSEREEYIVPISKYWADRVFIERKYDLPEWVSIMYEDFERDFNGTTAFESLSKLELDIQYTKIPTARVDNNGRLILNIALMPFLMQINYTYLFCMKICDKESQIDEIRQKIMPLLVFQSNPVATSISGLPVIYGLNQDEVGFAKQISFNQIYFMILHEIGHQECNHTPGEQPEIKINSALGPKEIEADLYAFGVLENIKDERRIFMAVSIVILLSFYLLSEELKNKIRNQDSSVSYTVFSDRLHLAKIFMRSAVDKFGPDTIEKTSFDAVEEAAIQYMFFALYPLGIVQQTIDGMSVAELQEFCGRYTDEGITNYFKENKDAEDNN